VATSYNIVLCSDLYVYSVEQCAVDPPDRFWFSLEQMPWESAVEVCMARDSTLVMIENQSKQLELASYLSSVEG